jgi:hypothetical protein
MSQKGSDIDGRPVYWLNLMAKDFKPARALGPSLWKLSNVYRRLAEKNG